MNSLTLFSLIAGALELSVPVYGLLLMRRFGRRSVGRFLIWACCTLALLDLVHFFRSNAIGLANLDLIVAFASGLLLIGMGHLQTLCTERRQSQCEGQKLTANWQLTVEEQTAGLASANEELRKEMARQQESLQVLRQSEQQYRLVFTENPQPQWIFDLRSLRVLAVNRAALGLFDFTLEEFSALSVRRLLQPEAAGSFLRDVAGPCPKAQSRGRWPFCTKHGSRIEAEIGAVDLNYDGCPARLLTAIPIIVRPCPMPEPPKANIQTISESPKIDRISEPPKMEAAQEPRCKISPAGNRITSVQDGQSDVFLLKAPEPAPNPEPKKSVTVTTRPVAPMPGPISLAGRSSTPLDAAPKLTDLSRTVVANKPDSRPAQVTPVAPKPAPRRSASCKETILLVDPEGKSRGLARFVLTRHGYRVIETDCPSTVLALWEGESTSVDVLLTDIALPEGISGPSLADQLRQTKPELKVIYTSAPSETDSEDELIAQNIIPKPYTPDKLLEAVKNCLVR